MGGWENGEKSGKVLRGNMSSMVMGDVRASGFETTKDVMGDWYEMEKTVDGRTPLEIDREYRNAMIKVRTPTMVLF